MDKSKLAKLDDLLDIIEGISKRRKTEEYRLKYFQLIVDVLNLRHSDNVVEDLFHQTNSGDQKGFIAVCLLRLLSRNHRFIVDWEPVTYRARTCKFFDDEIADIYQFVKVHDSDETHIKLSKLRDVEGQVRREFETLTDSVSSISTAIQSRPVLMRALRNKRNRLFLDHFVDPSLMSNERLNELFEVLKQGSCPHL
jgi:hypothetical protein